MRKKKKLLLVFFTTIILSLQIFYIIAYAAVPSYSPTYWRSVFRNTNFYSLGWTPSDLPDIEREVNRIDEELYFSDSFGTFIYTGPYSSSNVSPTDKILSPFDGDSAGINAVDGDPVTNCVLYSVPINFYSSNSQDLNITFTWFGNSSSWLKLGEFMGPQNFASLVPFAYYSTATQTFNKSYATSAVVRIYAYDSFGNYSLIPSYNVSFGDPYVLSNVPQELNAYYYNGGGNGSLNYARDIEIFDYSATDIQYLQIYILSNNYGTDMQVTYSLFDGAIYNNEPVSSFKIGDSVACYFQRLGIKSSNWIVPPVDPTDEEIIIQGITDIGNKIDGLEQSLTIPNDIQKGIVDTQREELDNIGTDLKDIGASISGEGFFVEKGEVVHNNRFMNLFNVDHFNNSLGRVFDASVITRLFFLMITFGLMSYVLFGKAA